MRMVRADKQVLWFYSRSTPQSNELLNSNFAPDDYLQEESRNLIEEHVGMGALEAFKQKLLEDEKDPF